jgi:hypothetical protein
MGKKKAGREKSAASKRAVPRKEATAGPHKPGRAKETLSVAIIPEDELAAHFPAVEGAAQSGELSIRDGLLDDPRQRTTVLAHLLLEYCGGRLADRSRESVFWTRWYWQNRLCRMHEQLEHGGKRCDAERERSDALVEEAAELDADWDAMEQVEAQAVADADAALGPGPFKRPKFACVADGSR